MVQEIIVYRNPGEKALWDFFASANAFPFIAGVFVFVLAVVASAAIIDRLGYSYRKWAGGVELTIGAIAGIAVTWKLFV